MYPRKLKSLVIFLSAALLCFSGSPLVFAAAADHIVISQVQIDGIDGVGGTEDDWVELYNPTNSGIEVSEWSIRKTSESGGSLYSKKLSGIITDVIPAHGYFLIVRNHADTTQSLKDKADVLAAGTSFSLSSDNTIYLVSNNEDIIGVDDPDIVDMVGMGEAQNFEGTATPNPQPEQSLERRPGGGNGSGEDTDDNSADFFEQTSPDPRNSQSPAEPPAEEGQDAEQSTPPGEDEEKEEDADNASESGAQISEPFVLKFTEIMPNPDGADSGSEWVEIYNPGSSAFDLSGWILDDEGDTTAPGRGAYILEESAKVPAGGYLAIIIPKGRFALNNAGGDAIRLFDEQKILYLEKPYPGPAASGKSYAADEFSDWQWTGMPAPGGENKFAADIVYSKGIVITEVLPNPAGDDAEGEFIELYNSGTDSVDLSSWVLADNRGRYAVDPDDFFDTEIAPGGYFVFYREISGITLNNSGAEEVSLYNPAGELADQVRFDAKGKGEKSFASDNSKRWQWTLLATPGKKNIIEPEDVIEPEESTKQEPADFEEEAQMADVPVEAELADIRNLPVGTQVETSGVVVVEPGLLEDNVIYLQGSGIRVVFDALPAFALEAGMKLALTGELSSFHNELQLKVSDTETVRMLEETAAVIPHEIKTGEVREDTEGFLVSVSGMLTRQSGNTFFIDDGSGVARIYIRDITGIEKPPMKKGGEVLVVGVVSQFNDNYRIMPRYQSDIIVAQVEGAAEVLQDPEENTELPQTGVEFWLILALFLGIWYIGLAGTIIYSPEQGES